MKKKKKSGQLCICQCDGDSMSIKEMEGKGRGIYDKWKGKEGEGGQLCQEEGWEECCRKIMTMGGVSGGGCGRKIMTRGELGESVGGRL